MATHFSSTRNDNSLPQQGHPIRRRLIPDDARLTPIARPRDDDHDLKLFALSFTAFFICIYTLIC
ncbi:MAG: hypothetical protein ACKVOB_07350 [Sphingomonas sp.]